MVSKSIIFLVKSFLAIFIWSHWLQLISWLAATSKHRSRLCWFFCMTSRPPGFERIIDLFLNWPKPASFMFIFDFPKWYNSNINWLKHRLEPRVAELKAQTNPLSYGGTHTRIELPNGLKTMAIIFIRFIPHDLTILWSWAKYYF